MRNVSVTVKGIIMSGQYSRPKITKETVESNGKSYPVEKCRFKINPGGSKPTDEPFAVVIENHSVIPWITSGRELQVEGFLVFHKNEAEDKNGKKVFYINPTIYARHVMFTDTQPKDAVRNTLELMKRTDLINEDQYNAYSKRLKEEVEANFRKGREVKSGTSFETKEVKVPPEEQDDDSPL